MTLAAKANPEVAEDISSALKRLTGSGRGGIGQLFKVVAISDPKLIILAGLSEENHSEKAVRR